MSNKIPVVSENVCQNVYHLVCFAYVVRKYDALYVLKRNRQENFVTKLLLGHIEMDPLIREIIESNHYVEIQS